MYTKLDSPVRVAAIVYIIADGFIVFTYLRVRAALFEPSRMKIYLSLN